MKRIKLTQGKFALVDDGDFEYLNQWKWCAHRQRDKWYAKRALKRVGTRRPTTSMHRELMGSIGMKVDHRDGNGLNNQRSNLRKATNAENGRNRGKQKNNTTGYKGVFRNSKLPYMFEAKIGVAGKSIYLGLFKTEELASEAYKKASIKYHKEFSCV